jgi:hypothetical protein
MKTLVAVCAVLTMGTATAEEPRSAVPSAGTRIFQTDRLGRVQHNKPSWIVKEKGRLIEVSPYGKEQSQKQQYRIEGNSVYHADFAGRIQYDKPSYSVEKDGRVIQNSPYGHPQYDAPQFVVDGSKVYAADEYGRKQQQAFEVERKTPSDPKR